jgi:SAM-dependent MidA family methyltransferase
VAGDWLTDPGERDLTAHVDLTAVRRTAEACGLVTLGILDQTYFLLSLGLAERLETGHDQPAMRQRLAARTIMMPGGLGSTMKAMVFAKNVGRPPLRSTASGRLT